MQNLRFLYNLYNLCTFTDPLYIIMEYVHRGSMLSYLRKCRPSSIRTMENRSSSFMQPRAKDLTVFALQVARGMAHLASYGVCLIYLYVLVRKKHGLSVRLLYFPGKLHLNQDATNFV